ncbi:MAG TPA: YeeE/YedE thiosulfate transporter family protein [Phycisphaerae bacterium]|nr:YeeE/YedE thiosulfate transporter family protein [Phycisphaerae bacterium]
MNQKPIENRPLKPFMNPYLAGVILGLALLASYLILGAGLGASGGIARISAWFSQRLAPDHTQSSEYFGAWGETPLWYYLVFMLFGIVVGGLLSAILARRVRFQVERGAKASRMLRLSLALLGGVLVGFAARLARGCTSGQALSGSALALSGSLVFLLCMFAGGYAVAWFVRRQWHD